MNAEAILLGSAQDGGLPQAGCDCPHCRAAHDDPRQGRWVTCLGLVDHEASRSWLIDATPDFRDQLHLLQSLAPECELSGIVLTHAHVGHYAGLIHLGREAWNTQRMPVYVSARMAAFLREQAPWSQLVALHSVDLRVIEPDQPIALSPRLHMIPLQVPHRGEFSDTLAFVVQGRTRRLFYCPDIDAWDGWDVDLRGFVGEMDVALLDGTFFSADELPGRDLGEVPHPLVSDTAGRLAGVGCEVRLVHLNHSNPLLREGREREWLAGQGVELGERGMRWRLG